MNSLFPSVLRTAVPLLVGWIVTGTGALGVHVDSTTVAGGVTAAVALAYYLLFRILESAATHLSWEPLRVAAGLLLGWARPPHYDGGAAPSGTGTVVP